MKLFFSFLIFAVFTSSCHKFAKPKQTVARVGSFQLSLNEFSDQLSTQLSSYKAFEVSKKNFVENIKMTILDEFLYRSLLKEWALSKKTFVHPNELETEIQKIKNSYPNQSAFDQTVKESGQKYQAWKTDFHFRLLESKVLKKIHQHLPKPDISEQKDFYKSNQNRFQQSKAVKIRHMVFNNKETAQDSIDALRKGRTFMSILSQQERLGTLKIKSNGMWLDESNDFLFVNASKLKKGQHSDIIESIYGYHIIQLIDKKNGVVMPFEQIQKKVINEIMTQKQKDFYNQWLRSQLKTVKVFVNQKLIDGLKVQYGNK